MIKSKTSKQIEMNVLNKTHKVIQNPASVTKGG